MFVTLVVSPWIGLVDEQRIFIIVGAFAALVGASVGPISSWVTLVTGIPAMLAILNGYDPDFLVGINLDEL